MRIILSQDEFQALRARAQEVRSGESAMRVTPKSQAAMHVGNKAVGLVNSLASLLREEDFDATGEVTIRWEDEETCLLMVEDEAGEGGGP